MTKFELSARFFLQIFVILAVCRVVGWLGRRFFKQPQVVGEMIAGVVLGPSLIAVLPSGWQGAATRCQQMLFPEASMNVVFVLSQLGLALYMFLIGVDFRVDLVRRRMGSALGISAAGIAAPFALGGLIAWAVHARPDLFTAHVSVWQAVLFLGAAMSITAFPMLARIIFETGLGGTRLGTLALAAGSIDDAACWCVLAAVLASFTGQASIAAWAIGGGLAYVVLVWALGRPLLARVGLAAHEKGGIDGFLLACVLMLLSLGCWFTDAIGLYAVFGAFAMGMAVPRGKFAGELIAKLEPVTTNLLLPLFFVFSGLNTRIGLINSWPLWGLTLVVLLAAVLGKGGACWLAARWCGESNRDAAGIGTLMNARGLMELIIINIGLQRGIITPTLFTIMVIMAILTTLMTSPVFEWVYRAGNAPAAEDSPPGAATREFALPVG